MSRFTAQIIGMHCAGCAMAVEQALKNLPGVRSASVDHRRGAADIEADPEPARDELEGALRGAGFGLGDVSHP